MSRLAELLLTDDEFLKEIASTLADSAGVLPRGRERLRRLLIDDGCVVFDAAKWGADDTEVRERLGDLADRALGVTVDARHEDYTAQLVKAAEQAGWVVSDHLRSRVNADGGI